MGEQSNRYPQNSPAEGGTTAGERGTTAATSGTTAGASGTTAATAATTAAEPDTRNSVSSRGGINTEPEPHYRSWPGAVLPM